MYITPEEPYTNISISAKNKKTKTPETIILCSDSEEDAVMTDADEDDKLEVSLLLFHLNTSHIDF